jgi:benzoyl-CoA reductase/2-hydroxyglutaryl-CoA dehydratase subunit BcrC/BadD/HgdB
MTEEKFKQVQRVQALKDLKQINFFYYAGLHEGKQKGTPIVYTNALGPIELIYAMEMLPVYPENHSVAIQAKRMALETAQAAESIGYTPDICSYIRCDLGYMHTGKSPIGGIPAPDLVVYASCQCYAIGKWFEEIARYYGVPFFVIDVPSQGRGFNTEASPAEMEYVKHQVTECIQWLEKHGGHKMAPERLHETVSLSRRASQLWYLILEYGKHVPAPYTLFDQYVAMAPIVDQRGKEVTVKFYEKLISELDERVKKNIGGIPNERYRLYWDGLPLWHSVGDFYNMLLERDVNFVANNYTRVWAQLSVTPENIIEDFARNMLKNFDPVISDRAFDIAEAIRNYNLDGFVLHSDHSCRFLSLGLIDTLNEVSRLTGIPGLLLDNDHGDPRLYQPEQTRTRIDAYLEMLDKEKA